MPEQPTPTSAPTDSLGEVTDAYVDTIAAHVRDHLASFCSRCARPRATDTDWAEVPEGEGGHLCWEPDESCGWEFTGIDTALRAAEAIVALMGLPVRPRQPEMTRLPLRAVA